MGFKESIQIWKSQRIVSRWLRDYWKIKESGQSWKELDDMADKIMQQRIELCFCKKEIKKIRKQYRKSWPKMFYMKHLFGFIISDTGQIVERNRLIPAMITWLRLNGWLLVGKLFGCFNYNQNLVRSRFNLYLGYESASRRSGISEDLLLKPIDEILGHDNNSYV